MIAFFKADWTRTKFRHKERIKVFREFVRYMNSGYRFKSALFMARNVL